MLSPNQTLLLHDYFTRSKDLWLLCEKYDCDHDQMIAIIGAITPYLPGKGLDYNAILSNDPIACDHLVLHCQRSIGQLDGLYDRLISLFDSSSTRDLQINKRTTVNTPPDWAKPSFSDSTFRWDTSNGSEKIETTTLENKQRFRILESAMKCLERGLKMQITLTQRKEKLQHQKPRAQQETQTAKDPTRSRSRSEDKSDSPYSGLTGYSALTGYNLQSSPLAPREEQPTLPQYALKTCKSLPSEESERSSPLAPRGDSRAIKSGAAGWLYSTTRAAKPQGTSSASRHLANNVVHQQCPREEEPVTTDLSVLSAPPRETSPPDSASEPGTPGWLNSTTRAAQPQEASSENRNNDSNMSHLEALREEEPVATELSAPSAPPREPHNAIPKIPHPQYSAPTTNAEADWQTYIPIGMDNGLEDGPMEEFIYPVFSHPYSEKEKVHYFPPFTEATPEDAEEIDAYLKSLPAEINADKNIGGCLNAYLVAPVIRTTQSEAQYTIQHRRQKRIAARKQAHCEASPQLQLATAEAHDSNEPSYHQRE